MEDVRENIQDLLDQISSYTGRSFNVQFKGLLVTIFDGSCIIFTSAGRTPAMRYQAVETFLSGITHGIKIS